MNRDRFWEIIDRTTGATSKEEQLELLRWDLQQLSLDELDVFGQIFTDYFVEAYNWDLWLVAWLARRGICSDDSFHYLRLWLISRGRKVCENALANPEAVAELIYEAESPSFESFGYVLTEVRRHRTDRPLANVGSEHPKKPSRGDWLRPELKDRTGSHMLNLCVVFNDMGDPEFAAIERQFPRVWQFCIQKGIIKVGDTDAPAREPSERIPTPEEVARSVVDPNLAKTNFPAYLKALADAARDEYNRRRNQE